MKIDASNMHFQILNEMVRQSDKDVTIDNCIGQRYIGSGQSGKHIVINGTPGNALGAYLNGADITVWGNAQDATGDTMNEGAIVIHGSSGDATGYAMRGGKILVEGDAGYRAGIHMKSYQDKVPVLMIGGKAGSFLGEYQAGGIIIVLGLDGDGSAPVGNFCGTGMHGGKMFLRCRELPKKLPDQIVAEKAAAEDMAQIDAELDAFCRIFDRNKEEILAESFYVLTPNTKNPYKQLYTSN